MSLFGKSRDSAFDLLGQAREKILSSSPKIPPPGTLARPGRGAEGAPRFSGGPVASPVIERAVTEFLDVDGDPLLVIDDELDVAGITPEDAVVDEEPARVLGVRTDTAIVFGIGLVLVVAIAYLAGRTAKPETKTPVADPSAKTALQPPPQAPPVAGSPIAAPETAPAPVEETKPAAEESPAPRAAAAGAFEIWIATTSESKAKAFVTFLNENAQSPISGMRSLQAYGKKAGTLVQVRIGGFEKKDESLLERVRSMTDPTGGSGKFPKADFHPVKS